MTNRDKIKWLQFGCYFANLCYRFCCLYDLKNLNGIKGVITRLLKCFYAAFFDSLSLLSPLNQAGRTPSLMVSPPTVLRDMSAPSTSQGR